MFRNVHSRGWPLYGLAFLGLMGCAGPLAGQTPPPPAAAVLTKYCIVCHNAKLKTAGLVIEPANLADLGEHAETWEKVVGKLRAGAMPPAGMPRPDAATYNALATFLETGLDHAASEKPTPGRLPLLHRLSRTEYGNVIRDLLAIEALPKEMDYSVLLPADNASSGFDNLADLLFISPTDMERYLDAARKVSRLAIGDPAAPVMVNIYRLSSELPQDGRADPLPAGTRGGMAIKSDFPLNGEYVIKVELAGTAHEPQQLEISVDGARSQLITVGSAASGGGRRAPATKPLEFRIPIQAGSREIDVTFLQHSEARDEAVLRPRTRGRGSEVAIDSVTISGPYGAKTRGDSESRRRIFGCRPQKSEDELPCAKQILSTLERRAYRRPVTDHDLQYLMPFYTAGRAEGDFDRGIQKALERLLVSPQFLFRVEHDPPHAAPGTTYRVSDLELASRLSFLLWSSMPDDQLLDAAAKGALKDPAALEKQVRRMLADPRSESLVTNFASQWLFLHDVAAKEPDGLLFPDFDDGLRADFERETELFLKSVLLENRSMLDLLSANYTFVNDRLAKHYGIPNIEGSQFRRITLPAGSPRGGLLGQGSILTLTSYSTRTSPVVRGKWVLENLLSAPPPPPPPNIPALKTEGSGKTLSMREAMEMHRANPACAGCHARMDPIGFAMENFDAVGAWRTSDAGNPIDASGVFPDGTKFNGMAGLKQALLSHPDQFLSTVVRKLLMYATSRNLQYYDEPAVRAILRDAKPANDTFAALVLGVVKSPQFQMREVESGERNNVHH